MDYDGFATSYARTRWALPWVLRPLVEEMATLPAGSRVLEIGCGTGNYITAAALASPHCACCGFDVSERMLAVARSRGGTVVFALGDAEVRFPYPDSTFALAFAVDVIHHILHTTTFLQEAARVLKPGGRLLVVTDSEANIRERSLTAYFPEILEVELDRYPKLETLHESARGAGLTLEGTQAAQGTIEITDDFLAGLTAKCSSAMRLIPEEAHQRGLERVRQGRSRGEQWRSCYTVVTYVVVSGRT